MTVDETIIGFDGGADDVGVVVMRRSADGTWRVDPVGGSDVDECVARIVEGLLERSSDPVPQVFPTGGPWEAVVARWTVANIGVNEDVIGPPTVHNIRTT